MFFTEQHSELYNTIKITFYNRVLFVEDPNWYHKINLLFYLVTKCSFQYEFSMLQYKILSNDIEVENIFRKKKDLLKIQEEILDEE